MKNYTNNKAKILYLIFLIGIIHFLHQFNIINFIQDSYYFLVPITFLFTFILWNVLLISEKKNTRSLWWVFFYIHSLYLRGIINHKSRVVDWLRSILHLQLVSDQLCVGLHHWEEIRQYVQYLRFSHSARWG